MQIRILIRYLFILEFRFGFFKWGKQSIFETERNNAQQECGKQKRERVFATTISRQRAINADSKHQI